jgi:hypothetical protein
MRGTACRRPRCHAAMKTLLALLIALSAGAAVAAEPDELITAPNAILCMSADSLNTATAPPVAKSQVVLQAMGCLRSEAGIRTRVVRNAPDGAWQVRFYPQGISGGVMLWGRPEAFTARDGSRLNRT